ncbi:SprT-like family protein [Halogranum gelatinilyticum]|uniref:SprT-like family protein n=1 Tax=Halogranum gelatinilyticum TaxID=660521 RepID=A0A1G9XHK7_9EURY|nr:SprT-like family protein [Halogranum gelatinilyticum]
MADDAVPDAYETLDSHAALVAWSRRYAHTQTETTDLAVDLSRVEWEVSTRAKRRAAAVKRPRIPDAAVGTPVDWSSHDATADPHPPTCTVSLTWEAAQSFDREEWAATLRHELVHVEQFQRFGTTNHGSRFKHRAETLDTPVKCRRFATPKFVLSCGDCEQVVARRYRDCKLVREHSQYQSSCCAAALRCQRVNSQ